MRSQRSSQEIGRPLKFHFFFIHIERVHGVTNVGGKYAQARSTDDRATQWLKVGELVDFFDQSI